MHVKSTAVIVGWFLVTIVQRCINGRTYYYRMESLDNREVTEVPSKTYTSISDVGQCARLCRQQDCVYLRHDGDVCSLYDVLIHVGLSPAPGAIYYRTCPTRLGFVFAESTNLSFKVRTETKTWEDSHNTCYGDGGRLVVLDTDDKHNYVKNYIMEDTGTSTVWVGMNKSTTSGPFRWLTGSTHTTKWDVGEPDYVSHQNCVYLYRKDLVDTECYHPRRSICEIVLQ
ncbi:C-type lectin lectoxin-Lio2-like [Haliotis rubra]|uniref:C-type lectin lectoxin-Lio2-like n=1 Tax=Haliotis rubra TaxID=36100 RepID=UPI001EE62CFA|nr:C-type lectin lectoxin-Lio2-like [Haliotis rubra]